MSNRKLVDKSLTIDHFNDDEVRILLDWMSQATSGSRWVIGNLNSRLTAVWPEDGTACDIQDPVAFCRDRNQIGVVFPDDDADAFCARFGHASNPIDLLRVAGKVAPLICDLHPGAYGIDYDLRPSDKVQRLINLFGRFLPKRRAIAIQSEIAGKRLGIYIAFNHKHQVSHIIGMQAWPSAVVDGGGLSGLLELGCPVEIGIRITPDAFRSLFEDKLNRKGYAKLFKKGEIVLDPLPLAPRLALKAARII